MIYNVSGNLESILCGNNIKNECYRSKVIENGRKGSETRSRGKTMLSMLRMCIEILKRVMKIFIPVLVGEMGVFIKFYLSRDRKPGHASGIVSDSNPLLRISTKHSSAFYLSSLSYSPAGRQVNLETHGAL